MEMTDRITHLDEIRTLVARKALFVVNDSGGKDSQAMKALVRALVLAAGGNDDQILVAHADLLGVEWQGTEDHVRKYSEGLEVRVCHAIYKDGSPKSLLGYWEQRGRSPSPQQRWCTSDLKRGPLEKLIRGYIKEKGLSGLVVSCEGIRGDESNERSYGMDKKGYKAAKKRGDDPEAETFKLDDRNSKAGREWYKWWPIFDFTTEQVFATIREAGQEPHWAYSKGMERLSCCFCIYATADDLRIAAEHNPDLFAEYVEMERKTGFMLVMPKRGKPAQTLEDITGLKAGRTHLRVMAA